MSMASGLSRPSRVLKKARIGEAGWLRNPGGPRCRGDLAEAAQAAGALVEGDAVPADPPLHARRPMVALVLADPGELWWTSMPRPLRRSAWPMPESSSSCGR